MCHTLARWIPLLCVPVSALALDLRQASIVINPQAKPRERMAARLLAEEVEKRTHLRWPIATSRPSTGPWISLATRAAAPAEGFTVRAEPGGIAIEGNDERGTLFAAGWLLRQLQLDRLTATAPDSLAITTAPKYRLRGHQIGYRPKVNAYDGWTPAQMEQYFRDLIVFGANAVELIPPRSDDDDDSPHFTLPKLDMMAEASRILDSYGIDVWIWYPAMDKDYSDPATVEFALKEWETVYKRLPRIDAIFVPGGDPGHTQPRHLMALLERQTQLLRKYHPKAQMWVSPQSFSREWLAEFIDLLRKGPAWLDGIVYGPQVRVDLAELRKLVPARYPIRNYPDITHSRHCQFPVPDWDLAYAITEGREVINPRPTQMTRIFQLQQPHTMGFLTYSEGVNDDVNKAVWSALGWNPDTRPEATLREFARYFFGPRYAGDLTQALLGLERNWRGPLLANQGVETLLTRLRAIEQTAPPSLLSNWRFQQILYRAYYDAHVRRRLIAERAAEQQAYEALERAPETGTATALDTATRALAALPASQDLRARLGELAEAMFQSIRAQLSVSRYRAIATERGANLDTAGMPLNNRIWLTGRFAAIRQLATEPERLREIRALVNRASPGPGGHYDDLGDPTNQPHVLPGPGFTDDPEFRRSRLISFGLRGTGAAFGGRNYLDYPIQWWRHAEALHDLELTLEYPDLDPTAAYRLRVVYTGDRTEPRIRAVANGSIEVHPLMARPVPFAPLEFDIPPAATSTGKLRLSFHREKGLGDAGRGMAVSEVWLLRK